MGADHDQPEEQRTGAHQHEVGRRPPSAARAGPRREPVAVAQEGDERRERDQGAREGVAAGELGDRAGRQQGDGGPPGPVPAPLDPVCEQQQQHPGAQREGGREGAERAGEHLGEGARTAVPGVGEGARGEVEQARQGARPAGEDGGRLGARGAEQAA